MLAMVKAGLQFPGLALHFKPGRVPTPESRWKFTNAHAPPAGLPGARAHIRAPIAMPQPGRRAAAAAGMARRCVAPGRGALGHMAALVPNRSAPWLALGRLCWYKLISFSVDWSVVACSDALVR